MRPCPCPCLCPCPVRVICMIYHVYICIYIYICMDTHYYVMHVCMQCNAMQCDVMLCHILQCNVMLCHVIMYIYIYICIDGQYVCVCVYIYICILLLCIYIYIYTYPVRTTVFPLVLSNTLSPWTPTTQVFYVRTFYFGRFTQATRNGHPKYNGVPQRGINCFVSKRRAGKHAPPAEEHFS